MNLFSKWRLAKDNKLFKTRSPYQDIQCYISPIPLPTCSNFSSYLPVNCSMKEILDYLEGQVRIVRFNNPEFDKFQVKTLISERLAKWKGNAILFKDSYYLNELLENVTENCYNDDEFESKIVMEYTKYWYSDDIESLQGKEDSISKKRKVKQVVRAAAVSENYVKNIRAAADKYSVSNFNVKPTLKILQISMSCSRGTIEKYGKDFYILSGENIMLRVVRARQLYPEYTQQQIADLLEEKKRTIKEYWKCT